MEPELGGALVESSVWTIHTDVFDGPLDLLLYLVKRDGIDLKRLSVARIADSYLAYLDQMRDLNLSVASEYLALAAELVHLKSLELLPRLPTLIESGEEEDPRETLARRLEEYAVYKLASEELDGRPWVGRDVFVRRPTGADDERPLAAGLDAFGLLELYWEILHREPPRDPVVQPTEDGLDFRRVCERVWEGLTRANGRFELGAFLRTLRTRAERVLAFIAVLEMTRMGWIDLAQAAHLGPVDVLATAGDDGVDLDRITGRVEVE